MSVGTQDYSTQLTLKPARVSLWLGGRVPGDKRTDGTRPNPGSLGPLVRTLYRWDECWVNHCMNIFHNKDYLYNIYFLLVLHFALYWVRSANMEQINCNMEQNKLTIPSQWYGFIYLIENLNQTCIHFNGMAKHVQKMTYHMFLEFLCDNSKMKLNSSNYLALGIVMCKSILLLLRERL